MWEYFVFFNHDLELLQFEACLNRHGELGWELVSIDRGVVVMKKPVVKDCEDERDARCEQNVIAELVKQRDEYRDKAEADEKVSAWKPFRIEDVRGTKRFLIRDYDGDSATVVYSVNDRVYVDWNGDPYDIDSYDTTQWAPLPE